MRFLKYTSLTILALVLIAGAGYLLAASGLKSKPGYVELRTPSSSLAEASLVLDLGPGAVKPLYWMVNRIVDLSKEDLKVSERMVLTLFQQLQGVQLRIYDVENNRQIFEQAIDDSVSDLKSRNWNTILKAKEDGKRVIVMQTEDAGVIEGLSVLVSTPENAVFINLIGPLDPESVAVLAYNLN